MPNVTKTYPKASTKQPYIRDDNMIAFGRYQLFPRLRFLLKDGVRLELGDRAFDVLVLLVNAAGQVVSKDTLLSTIWSKEVVEENSLQAQISSLRKTLGNDRGLITTEFGKGYRFTGTAQPHRTVLASIGSYQIRSGLPRPRSSLIGRAKELLELNRLLTTQRIITLAGPAGVGKTRLAIEVASESSPSFPDGIYFADLSQTDCITSVLSAISSALAGLAGAITPLTPHPSRALLVVDNCEHVASACAEVITQLLEGSTGLSVLLTSQTPLGIDGEQIYRIHPLVVPIHSISAAHAKNYSAIELFVRRVISADYHFQLTENNIEQITTLCRALDGVPLALEIAAARVPSLGLATVTKDLALSEGLLNAQKQQTSGRHRTLGDAMRWSYQRLNPLEQRVFQELAIFSGDFTLTAAEELLSAKQDDTHRLIDIVYSLVEKSFITLQAGTQPLRYRYLSMLRAYALDQLGSRTPILAEKHAHFVELLVAQAHQDWMSLPTSLWRRQYEHHMEDIRSALSWAFRDKQHRTMGLRILANSSPFWIQLSLHDECRQRITDALEEVDSPSSEKHQEMLIQAALATSLTWSRGPIPANGQAWSRASNLAFQLDDKEMQLQAEYGLWLFELRNGRYAQALQHGKNMAALALKHRDQAALLTARRLIGTSHHFLGNHAEALFEIESMLDSYTREEGYGSNFRFGLDQRVAGWAFLSRVLLVMGNESKARRAAQIAIDEATALDHACSLCCALAEGGCTVAALAGDAEEVERMSQQLSLVAANHGLAFWGLYGSAFAVWSQVLQKPDEVSFQKLHSALEKLQAHGFDPAYSVFLSDFTYAMIEQGHHQEAAKLIDSRLTGDAAKGQLWNAPELMRIKALALQHTTLGSESISEIVEQALTLAKIQHARTWEARLKPMRAPS